MAPPTAPPPPPPPPPAAVLRGHRADVQCVAVLPRRLSALARGGAGAAALEGSAMDLLLASGDAEGEVRIWDLQQRRALFSRVLHDSQAGVLHLAVVRALGAGGPALLSQGRDGVVKAWPLLLGKQEEALGANSNTAATAAETASAAAALPVEPAMELRGGCYSFCRFALAAVDRDADDGGGSGTESEEEGEEEQDKGEGGESGAADDEDDEDDRFPPQTRAVGFRAVAAPPSSAQQRQKQQPEEENTRALRPGLLKLALREEEEEDEGGAGRGAAAAAAADGVGEEGEGQGDDLTEAQELALVEGRPLPRPCGAGGGGGGGKGRAEHWLAMPAPDGTSLALWRLGGGDEEGAGAAGAAAPRAPERLLCQRERNAQGAPLHGMVMAAALLRPSSSSLSGRRGRRLHALVGYEDGVVGLWRCGSGDGSGGGGGRGGGGGGSSGATGRRSSSRSRLLSSARVHDEPVMCVAVLSPLPAAAPASRPLAPPRPAAPELRAGVSGAADDRLAVFTLSLLGGGGASKAKAGGEGPAAHDEAVEPALRLPMPRGGTAQVAVAWWRPPSAQPAAAASSAAGRRPSCRPAPKLLPIAAAAAWDGRVRVWALSGGGGGGGATAPAPLAVLRHHGPPAAASAVALFTARGGCGDGDLETEDEEDEEQHGDGGALWLASGGRDGTVAIWDALLTPPSSSSS